MEVAEFGGDAEEWDGFVRGQNGWTHYHLYGWRAIMRDVLGHECLYLAARADDGGVIGVLPLVRVKSLIFGHYLVSMPFLNYGGPLGQDDAIRALGDRAILLAKAGGVKLLELRSRKPLPLAWPVSHRKITVLLDIPQGGAPALWRGLDAKVRSQVRRSQKEDVRVRFGLDQVRPFFQVFSRHMRDLGTPTQPLKLFDAIASVFPQDAWFACAYLDEQPIAVGCGFRWGVELEITWASSLLEHKRIAPNMLLYWSLMERAATEGVRVFNFGRCTPDSGTHQFKRQWGTRDESLWWYEFAAVPGTTTPSPTDSSYAWGPRLWRRLPPALARAIGPRIVRYLP